MPNDSRRLGDAPIEEQYREQLNKLARSISITKTKPPATRTRELRKAQGLTLKQVAQAIGAPPQTMQRLEVNNMTVSLTWLYAIAEALDVPPSKLLIDPQGRELSGDDDPLLDLLRSELIRARRAVPSFDEAPLALFEATGKLAGMLCEWQRGLRRRDELAAACAVTAAAAMRIALDAGTEHGQDRRAASGQAQLVASGNGRGKSTQNKRLKPLFGDAFAQCAGATAVGELEA